ncbi:hypothetical protein [Pelosinus sp. IPA-1]|uniref:rolling circle replication-associated protein n=1 Tax=Pelosinus sp. IPA-1 TaxID=3029569 RepID=UPI00243616A3|nr:hypothetical protein [Pelosinus sp. IPA-1]GMB02050.1 hypothetical protein PIPA1_48500 [Pelosinus sp. IPA-1]
MPLNLEQEKLLCKLWEASEEKYQEFCQKIKDLRNKDQVVKKINHKVIHCGDVIEIYEFEYPTIIGLERKKKPASSINQPVISNPKTLLKKKLSKTMRIYHNFIRLAYVNFNNTQSRFVTLTFLAQDTDLGECNKCFDSFMKRMRRRFGKTFKYIAVPSFDSIGSIRYHMFFDIAVEHVELSALWSHGRTYIKLIQGSKSLDKLIFKYMRQTLLDEKSDKRLIGKKTYFKSRNLNKPVELYNQNALNVLEQFHQNPNEQYPVKIYESVYNGEVKYQKLVTKT